MCVCLYISCILKAIERNAMLENELDEKQRMGEMCQRLKDEVRGERAKAGFHFQGGGGGGGRGGRGIIIYHNKRGKNFW